MFSEYLIHHFVKNYTEIEEEKVRDSYGYLAGIIGIILNLVLFIVKFIIGLVTFSIAITADSFNNLSDSASSLITILGFKLSAKPADLEHPFGHGRLEYLSGLMVSFLVLLVGIEFIKTSFNRILSPVSVKFSILPFILILISILIKIWLSRFNKLIGDKIDSKALKASSFDALSDVITSSTTAVSFLLAKITSIPIDGYIGILISLFIIYSGYSLIKDTINPLLGEAPDKKLVKKLEDTVLSYEYITGVHDTVIHNYGPGRVMASIHAEVPYDISIMKIHEIIDKAEKEISILLKMQLIIHMDPINNSEYIIIEKKDIVKILKENFSYISSIHDFRIVGDGDIKNLIFDVVIKYDKNTKKTNEIIEQEIISEIKKHHPLYNIILTIDKDFTR
ncbi:MAG: cation diffusion facilitator family transporter [Clostridiaceae bacterium]